MTQRRRTDARHVHGALTALPTLLQRSSWRGPL